MSRRVFSVLVGLLCACSGNVSETLSPKPFTPTVQETSLQLSATPSFADERGGGVFLDLVGRAVRMRTDGTKGSIEAHPRNPATPGPATGVWALGPSVALVATSKGLFTAEGGWLIAPPWRDFLETAGVIATAVADDGVGWLAHEKGVFRLQGGQLSELKVGGASVVGVTAMAVAPAPSGQQAVWFAQGTKLTSAILTSTSELTLRDSGLSKTELTGGVRALAGISASATAPGELWVITPTALFEVTRFGAHRVELGHAPRQLVSAGRVAWLQAGDGLFRYDADTHAWTQATGFEQVPTLLAADAAGAAWVRLGEKTVAVSALPTIRLEGLFQGEKLYDSQVAIEVVLPASQKLTGLTWFFDADAPTDPSTGPDGGLGEYAPRLGTGPEVTQAFYSLVGNEASGAAKFISLGKLSDGPHTLTVSLTFDDGTQTSRAVPFELHAASSSVPTWNKDIRPISESRCSKCHVDRYMPVLVTYDDWKRNAAAVGEQVRLGRMPADGPLDNAGVQVVQRWVNGGALP